MKRVSLLPHRTDWTELERDAVAVIESYIAERGRVRPGEVIEVPLTIGHVQKWLHRVGARRTGRDYARTVLAKLIQLELLRDTGRVMKPRRQPTRSPHTYWWRVFSVPPIQKARYGSRRVWRGAYGRPGLPTSSATASLCRFVSRQGLTRPRRTFNPGSVQWAFRHTGPP